MTLDLSQIKAATFDLDGVVWRDNDALPGTPALFHFLKARGIPYMMLSNNSTKTLTEYVHKLTKFGIEAEEHHILNSGSVTGDYLAAHYPSGTPIYVLGSPSLATLLAGRGFPVDPANARAVVVGLDIHLTYEKLKIAGRLVLNGAEFIATNNDATFPNFDGLAPGAGTMVCAVQTMTGVVPKIMGKPETVMFESALARLGTAPEHTLMVGDRLDTDITGAKLTGMRTALVLTGVSQREHIDDVEPDAVYDSLAELLSAWERV